MWFIFFFLRVKMVQSLLATHDAIAQKDFYPHLPEIPIEVDEDEETVKIVQLVKSNEPLVCIDIAILSIILTNLFDSSEWSIQSIHHTTSFSLHF